MSKVFCLDEQNPIAPYKVIEQHVVRINIKLRLNYLGWHFVYIRSLFVPPSGLLEVHFYASYSYDWIFLTRNYIFLVHFFFSNSHIVYSTKKRNPSRLRGIIIYTDCPPEMVAMVIILVMCLETLGWVNNQAVMDLVTMVTLAGDTLIVCKYMYVVLVKFANDIS